MDIRHGPVHLYYGCRSKASQLFQDEIEAMIEHKVINKLSLAYSRETDKSKVGFCKIHFIQTQLKILELFNDFLFFKQ